MQDKLEKLIKIVYRRWKSDQPKVLGQHLDEETVALFMEGKLSSQEETRIKKHLISCDKCIEVLAIQVKLKPGDAEKVPMQLLEGVKNLVKEEDKSPALEIILRVKEKVLEILNTTGDVLVGQELVPASILRSRKPQDFKDEVTILKDFKDIRVEAKIENKGTGAFSLTVLAKEKETQEVIKDLRVTLLKDDLELESYLADTGQVIFEHVLLGKYIVEISTLESKLASILLDIKI